jgi:hypothetical protein
VYVVVDALELMTIRVFIALSVVLLINIHPAKDHPLTTLGIDAFTSRLLPMAYSFTFPKTSKQNKPEQPKARRPPRLTHFHRCEPEPEVNYETKPKPKPQLQPSVKPKQQQAFNITDVVIHESHNCTISFYQGFPDSPIEMIRTFHNRPRSSDSSVTTEARLQAEASEDVQEDPISSPVEEIESSKPSDASSLAVVHSQPPCKIELDLPSDTIPLQEASASTSLTNPPSASTNMALVPFQPQVSTFEELHHWSTPACTHSAALAITKRDDCLDSTVVSIVSVSYLVFRTMHINSDYCQIHRTPCGTFFSGVFVSPGS